MQKIILSLFILLITVFAVGHGYALFQDLVVAENNQFYSGQFDLQISRTDADGDNIAETIAANWSGNTTGVWTTQQGWTPGDTIGSKIFLRNTGDVDAESVYLTLTERTYYGGQFLDEVVNLVTAWYDRNGDGVQDTGEDLLPDLLSQYDADANGVLTLRELYNGTDLVHSGVAYDLEVGDEVLPGVNTDDGIGGSAGHGKGLFLTWEYDPQANVNYQDAWVKVDLEFTAEQGVN